MQNFQKERLIKQAKILKNQTVSECKKCKGKGRPDCKCVKRSNLLIELAYANIPLEYWFFSLKGLECAKTVKEKIKKYCSRIKKAEKAGLGLCLFGEYGRGKTSLAIHILKKASLAEYSIYFSTLAELLSDIKTSFGFEGEELKEYQFQLDKNYIETNFLVVDNVGQEYRRDGSDFVPIVFDEIIRKRKANGKITIITTNKDPKKLKEVYGGALFSILQSSLKIIKVSGKDHRKNRGEELWGSL